MSARGRLRLGLVGCGGLPLRRLEQFTVGPPAVSTHQLALAAFARAIRDGNEPDATGEEGV